MVPGKVPLSMSLKQRFQAIDLWPDVPTTLLRSADRFAVLTPSMANDESVHSLISEYY
jgi:hypothetical protein